MKRCICVACRRRTKRSLRRAWRVQHLPAARIQEGTVSDWTRQPQALDALIEAYRGKHDYDCIVPFAAARTAPGRSTTW